MKILAVATLTQAFALGTTVGVFPLFLEPIEAAFDAPRTQIALGPVLLMGALCGAGIVAGGVLDKGRVRAAMIFGASLLASSLFLASAVSNLWLLALAALGAGFSIPFLGPLAGMTLVTRLFQTNQGRAFGIMSMGPGLGSGFFAGLAGLLLQQTTWQSIYRILAVAIVLLLIPIIRWVVPEQVDSPLRADGAAAVDATLGDVMRRPVFWLTAMVFATSAGVASGWTHHFAAYLGGQGLLEGQVTLVVALQFWMGVPGALAFGLATDRVPLTPLYFSMLLFEGIAFLLFAHGVVFSGAVVLGIACGFVIGGLVPLFMALLGSRLEPEILGRAMGLSNLVMLPVMSVAAIMAAMIFERDGNYDRALTGFGIAMLIAIASLLLSNRRHAQESRATA